MHLSTQKHRAVGWCAINLLLLQSRNLFHLCLSCSLRNNVYKNKIGSKNIECNKLWLHCVLSWGMSWPKSLQYFYLGLCFVSSYKAFHLLMARKGLEGRGWLSRAMVLGCLYLPGILISLPKEQQLCLFWNCKMKAQREAAQGKICWLVPSPLPSPSFQPRHHIPTTVMTMNPDTIMITLHGCNTPTISQALARVWEGGKPGKLIWHRSEI